MSKKQTVSKEEPSKELIAVNLEPFNEPEQVEKKEEPEKLDAFFERVLKKNKINKQYRRERMMKQVN